MSRFSLTLQLNNSQLATKRAAIFAVLDSTQARIILLILISVFGMTYLWLVNSSAQAGFLLTDLEQKNSELQEEYRRLEVEQAQLQSLDHIQKMSEQAQLVTAGRAEYVRPSDVALGQ